MAKNKIILEGEVEERRQERARLVTMKKTYEATKKEIEAQITYLTKKIEELDQ